eukprot:scaffold90883_cov30-Tisochrysis_lutea.AAC.1
MHCRNADARRCNVITPRMGQQVVCVSMSPPCRLATSHLSPSSTPTASAYPPPIACSNNWYEHQGGGTTWTFVACPRAAILSFAKIRIPAALS